MSYALCLMSFTLEQAYDTSKGKSGIKANSHTTRQHATRPVFSVPIHLNGSVHTYAARPSLVVTTKSCDNKNRSGSDFCHVSQPQYQENC